VLIKFHQDNQDMTEQIQKALNENDQELTQRLAHTVKGVAGNIGGTEIQKAAEKVEQIIKNNQLKGIDVLIDTLKEALELPMTDLKSIAHAQENEESNGEENPKGNLDQLREFLAELEPLLRKRKPKHCMSIIEKINAFDWPDEYKAILKNLGKLVSKYKFKDAAKTLSDLMSKADV
jgi:two-component system, sensor histidine kinase and response regulator